MENYKNSTNLQTFSNYQPLSTILKYQTCNFNKFKLGNITNLLNDITFQNYCISQAKKYRSNGRDFSTIKHQTMIGEAVERITCEALNLKKVSGESGEIIDYDAVDQDKNKIEIKHTTMLSKWWNFKKVSYEHFILKSKKIDYIILCYFEKSSNDVFLRFIADAHSFSDYVNHSRYTNEYYYNNEKAKVDHNLIEFKVN